MDKNPDDMSDELKLSIIGGEVNNLSLLTKMLLSVGSAIEAQRMFMSGELPERFEEVVDSEEFKQSFIHAAGGLTEIVRELIKVVSNLNKLYDIDFINSLPKDASEFSNMMKEISNRIGLEPQNETESTKVVNKFTGGK
jgi:hypothetical protein